MQRKSQAPQKRRTVAINVHPSIAAFLAAAAAAARWAAAARLAAAVEDRRMRAGGDCNFIVPHYKRCLAGCKHLLSNDFIFLT